MHFEPHPALKHPLLQTVSTAWMRRPVLEASETKLVEVSGGDRLATLVNYPDRGSKVRGGFEVASLGTVVLVPGLGATARSAIMARLARKFLSAGCVVVRMNPRGLGDGAPFARQVYHAARSEDISSVLQMATRLRETPTPIVVVGLSLGGNMVLREVGRSFAEGQAAMPRGSERFAQSPDGLAGVVALSPILNLQRCAQEFEHLYFGLINLAVTKRLRRFVFERHRAHPELGPVPLPKRFSLRDFDRVYTFPESGFDDIEEYYTAASAEPWLGHIEVPASIIISRDDPLARFESFRYPGNIEATVTSFGGHLGFLAKHPTVFRDHFWGDWKVVTTALSYLARARYQRQAA